MVDGGGPEITPGVGSGLVQRDNVSRMATIRVVTNHQVPLTAGNVSAGLRSGNGGVSEMEVSNGTAAHAAVPPYSFALRTTTPWGTALRAAAIQPL